MDFKKLSLLMLWAPLSVASISFNKSDTPSTPQEKVVADAKKVVAETDISGINTRLKVEGATFRQFNVYFPATLTTAASPVQKKLAEDIRKIVDRDLNIVGSFSFIMGQDKLGDDALMKQKGADGIARLSLTIKPDAFNASLDLTNLMSGKKKVKKFSGDHKALRRFAHMIAQGIFEEFIGSENLFKLQIAVVKREGKQSQIVLMDFDGHNETPITDGPWNKTSPYFAPSGKTLLYGVMSPNGQGIVEHEVGSKKFQFRTQKPGLNLDPRVMPNNSGMLATLSFENNANIYKLSRSGSIMGKLTQGLGLNLSPSIAPNGAEFAFVSDRSGSPQIYVQNFSPNSPAQRLTFKGKYNQTPHFSPDGQLIAFTGRDENKVFDIFLIERHTGKISRITEKQGRNQEPFFTPSGRFVIFTSEREQKPKPDIFIATLNGSHQFRLTDAQNDKKSSGYFSPVIRPEQP